jgi:chaperonin cofactor prefoldin
MGAVPRSAQPMNIDDQEGNQLYRFAVMTDFLEQYLQEARKANLNCRKFTYDYEKYKQDLEVKTKLEQRHEFLKVTLYFI